MTETEVKQKRAVRQGRLCDCAWGAASDNPWHEKLSSCPSSLELIFWRLMEGAGLPMPEREYRFHETRRFRMDFAWPEQKVAVEAMGGTWSGGRHSRGPGYEADCFKSNLALSMGWRMLRLTPGLLKDGPAVVKQVRDLLEAAPCAGATPVS